MQFATSRKWRCAFFSLALGFLGACADKVSEAPPVEFNFEEWTRADATELARLQDGGPGRAEEPDFSTRVPDRASSVITTDFEGRDFAFNSSGAFLMAGARYLSNGEFVYAMKFTNYFALDTSFSSDGVVKTSLGSNAHAFAASLTSDGQAYIGGRRTTSGQNWDAVVLRYATSGNLDSTFGTSGTRTLDLSSGGQDFLRASALDDSERYIGAGYSVAAGRASGFLVRLNSQGQFDTSFATVGYRFYSWQNDDALFFGLRRDGQGNFVVGGVQGKGTLANATIWRIRSNGDLDSSFYSSGFRAVTVGAQSLGYSAVPDPSGRILFSASYLDRAAGRRYSAVGRLLSDGNLDASFGTSGIFTTTTQTTFYTPWYVPMDRLADDRVAFASMSFIWRLNSNGTSDTSFAGGFTTNGSTARGLTVARGDIAWVAAEDQSFRPFADSLLVPYAYQGFDSSGGVSPRGSPAAFELGYFHAPTQSGGETLILYNMGMQTIGSLTSDTAGPLTAPFNYRGSTFPGTGQNCGGPLAPGTSCTIAVDFQTSPKGAYQQLAGIDYTVGGVSHQLSVPVVARASNLLVSSFPTYPLAAGDYCDGGNLPSFSITNTGSTSVSGLRTRIVHNTSSPLIASLTYACGTAALGAAGSCGLTITKSTGFSTSWSDDMARVQVEGNDDEGVTLKLVTDWNFTLLNCDNDLDGYTPNDGDCDDTSGSIYPGAWEDPCNGIDDNCDIAVDDTGNDGDGDGVKSECGDCNDSDVNNFPGNPENPCDHSDNDCDYLINENAFDLDADAFYAECGDCNDNDNSINPGATEVFCDGIDNDCDSSIDEGQTDADLDGYYAQCTDCNDADATIHPGATDFGCDQVDKDCSGDVFADADGDGYYTDCADCNDNDADMFPGNTETCQDSKDNDCNAATPDNCR